MSAKWSKKQLDKFRATMKAKKLSTLKEPENIKGLAYSADQLLDAGGAQQATVPVVDVRAREAQAYRRGLVRAMELILESLRYEN